jgi:hypothetical protein
MSNQPANRHAPLRIARAAVIAGMAVMTAPHQAAAQQSIFHNLSNFFGGSRDDRFTPTNAYAEPTRNSQRMPDLQAPPGIPQGGAAQGGSTTYCVRLCDGRYFPLSSPAASTRSTSAKVCAAMCPAAKTAVYRGSAIDGATAGDGERYADLANAFVYRTKVVPGCTCNGKDAFGLVNMQAAEDPTLRNGDVVATNDGFVAYSGNHKKTADNFTPINSASGVPAEARRALARTRIAPAGGPAPASAANLNSAAAARDGNDRQAQLVK